MGHFVHCIGLQQATQQVIAECNRGERGYTKNRTLSSLHRYSTWEQYSGKRLLILSFWMQRTSVIGLMLEPHKKVSSPLLYQLGFLVGLIEGDLLT
jgi:hypothetical protein